MLSLSEDRIKECFNAHQMFCLHTTKAEEVFDPLDWSYTWYKPPCGYGALNLCPLKE